MDQESLRASCRVLASFVRNDDARIAYATLARKAALKQVNGGHPATGYRVDWIRSTVQEMSKFLEIKIDEFNGAHPWDKIIGADLEDVAHTFLTAVQDGRRNRTE